MLSIHEESPQVYLPAPTASLVRLQRPLPVTSSFLPTSGLRSNRVTDAPCQDAWRAAVRPEEPAPITAMIMFELYLMIVTETAGRIPIKMRVPYKITPGQRRSGVRYFVIRCESMLHLSEHFQVSKLEYRWQDNRHHLHTGSYV
jgi:hypothetical protein